MKKYTWKNITTDYIPDPLKTDSGAVSPVSEALFKELGGTITDDGEPTPQEKFLAGLDTYLDGLEKKCRETLGLAITKAEFKAAAATMMSSDLVAWAKGKGVPDAMIDEVRNDVLVMIADASRLGMTWSDLFPKAEA